MALPEKESLEKLKIKKFFFILALLMGAIALGFSIFNQYSFYMIIFRTVLSFLIVFFLGKGMALLWEKLFSPPKKELLNKVDVLLDELNSISNQEKSLQPQELSLESKISDPGLQATGFPGQVNSGMKDGLPDAEVQAEIVRKMGWGKDS